LLHVKFKKVAPFTLSFRLKNKGNEEWCGPLSYLRGFFISGQEMRIDRYIKSSIVYQDRDGDWKVAMKKIKPLVPKLLRPSKGVTFQRRPVVIQVPEQYVYRKIRGVPGSIVGLWTNQ
jgi:hypothetical protein